MNYALFAIIVSLVTSGPFAPLRSVQQDAREIVKKAEDKARGNTFSANITIQITRPFWTREMRLRSWGKDHDYTLTIITAPLKSKGIAYLKHGKEVWIWNPSLERTIKLPPSIMNQSWMGTDLTNDDLVKGSSIVEDYSHTIIGDTVLLGRACYTIQLLPRPHTAVVWGKVILAIDRNDFLMLYAAYYDEKGKLIRILVSSDIKELGGRLLPSRMEIIPAYKKGSKTVMIYNTMEFDKPIGDDIFSINNLSRGR